MAFADGPASKIRLANTRLDRQVAIAESLRRRGEYTRFALPQYQRARPFLEFISLPLSSQILSCMLLS